MTGYSEAELSKYDAMDTTALEELLRQAPLSPDEGEAALDDETLLYIAHILAARDKDAGQGCDAEASWADFRRKYLAPEDDAAPGRRQGGRPRRLLRTALIAAAVAALMGVTAYAVHVLSVRDIVMDSGSLTWADADTDTDDADAADETPTGTDAVAETPAGTDVQWSQALIGDGTNLCLSGVQGTPDYEASQEYNTFYDEFRASDEDAPENWESDQWIEDHSLIYSAYTVQLEEKLLELCEKYGLKTMDKIYEYQGLDLLEQITGVDEIISTDAFDGLDEWYQYWYDQNQYYFVYDNGGFWLQGCWWKDEPSIAELQGSDTDDNRIEIAINRHIKGYFGERIATVYDSEAVTEESYTTARGDTVCLVLGSSGASPTANDDGTVNASIFGSAGGGFIIYDGPDAFVTVQASTLDDSGSMTMDDLKALADAVNFGGLGVLSEVDFPEEEAPSTDYDASEEPAE